MWQLAQRLWHDDAGVIISAELVLILTIVVLGVIVGLVEMRNAVVGELHDLSLAWSHLNQSYGYTGFRGCWKWWGGRTSWTAGSSFIDCYDGTNVLSTSDFCVTGGEYYAPRPMQQACCATCRGTIVLKDGTLIPLYSAGTGSWSLPGGTVLAEFSSARGRLLLADGTTIPFIHGCPGAVTLAENVMMAARPGAAGTVVLTDSRVADFEVRESHTVKLPDGKLVPFHVCPVDHVVLADGKVVRVTAKANDTLVLPEGQVINLHDAVFIAGAAQEPAPQGAEFSLAPLWQQQAEPFNPETMTPDHDPELLQPETPELTPMPLDPSAPQRPFRLAPPRFRREPPVIPQGPAPQYLPQV